MQYGFIVDAWDVRTIGELTEEAEAAGWDGLFISDALAIGTKEFPAFDFFDPWVALGVMATRSKRIRIGTIVTPVPRRRPWKLARETLTVDHLSNGRLILRSWSWSGRARRRVLQGGRVDGSQGSRAEA